MEATTFKIVSTQEKRGIYFTVVPHYWEKNGTLLWPDHLNHSQREILRSNAASVPDNGWVKYPCVVKCSHINSFQDALDLEKKLTECIDTDAEEILFEDTKRKRNKTKNNDGHHLLTDRNDMFAGVNETESINKNNVNVISQHIFNPIIDQPTEVINIDDEAFQTIVLEPNRIMNMNVLDEATRNVADDIIFIKSEISSLKNEFLILKNEIKQQLKEDYSKINLYLDKIFKVVSNKDLPNKDTPPKPKEDLLRNVKFPLASCEEISLLEKQIGINMEFRTQLIELLSKIGGRTGEEDGLKVAYKVVDCVFKPEILMQYSWTGISRGTSGEKKSFQMLDGILEVFFEVILLADNRHTKKKNCSIFKDGVLKHAKKRTIRKRIRTTKSSDGFLLDNTETDVHIIPQDLNNTGTGSDKENIDSTEEKK